MPVTAGGVGGELAALQFLERALKQEPNNKELGEALAETLSEGGKHKRPSGYIILCFSPIQIAFKAYLAWG